MFLKHDTNNKIKMSEGVFFFKKSLYFINKVIIMKFFFNFFFQNFKI